MTWWSIDRQPGRLAKWPRIDVPIGKGGWRARPTGDILIDPVHDPMQPEDTRFTYRCHPKRCGAQYTLKDGTVLQLVRSAHDRGEREVWLG